MTHDIIKPGDKIDIRLIQQINKKENNVDKIRIYKSQVYDVYKDGELEISMPTQGGKIILLPLGIRFEFVFYSHGGLYRAEGVVKERFKRDNLYALVVEIKSQLEKFQRREYYRLTCMLDMNYYDVSERDISEKTAEEIFDELRDGRNLSEIEKEGTIVDISGGGLRFMSDKENPPGGSILAVVRLTGGKTSRQFYLLGEVISCAQIVTEKGTKYENRIRFILRDNKVREEIIRYVFDEERRMRSMK